MTGFPLLLPFFDPLLESSSPSPSSPPGVPLAIFLWVWLVLSGDESGVSEDPDVRVRIGVPTLTTLPSRWTDWDGACGNA
jgi:hypothetical protein